MVERLIRICDILGADYSNLDNYNGCDKVDYLLDCILEVLGG